MKYFIIALAGLALAACGGAKDAADSAKDAASDAASSATDMASDAADTAGDMASDAVDTATGALDGFTRADYLSTCASADGMTAEKCECTLDAYEAVGLEFNDLDDAEKVQNAMSSMTTEQTMAFATCLQ